MYTDLQIDFIRAFGDKELKDGCIVRKDKGKWFKIAHIENVKYPDGKLYYKQARGYGTHGKFYQPKFKTELDFEILGSEPQWHDVFAKFSGDFIGLYKNQIDIGLPGIQKTIPCDASRPLLEQPQAMESLLSLTK